MTSTARLAHLQAVPGEGIRVGDPNGPHVLLTPQAVRVHRVKDDAAGTVRQEDVPWDRVRGLALRAPRKAEKPLGRRMLGWVGSFIASDVPFAANEMKEAEGEMTVGLVDDDARPATWRFRVLAMMTLHPKPAEADAAEALVARLAAEQSLRARLADPEALLQEHRAG